MKPANQVQSLCLVWRRFRGSSAFACGLHNMCQLSEMQSWETDGLIAVRSGEADGRPYNTPCPRGRT